MGPIQAKCVKCAAEFDDLGKARDHRVTCRAMIVPTEYALLAKAPAPPAVPLGVPSLAKVQPTED